MPRSMAVDDAELFRAVITVVRVGDRWTGRRSEVTLVVGPYRTRAAASQAITREVREAESSTETARWYAGLRGAKSSEVVTATGHVERAPVVWERVS